MLYGDFMNPESEEYVFIPDMDKLIGAMNTHLEDYNAVSKRPMELVLFPFAVEHVCRICRVIKQPFGNALLVGVGGSGRQSLTALATHVAGYDIFQIELSKNYDRNTWRDDLRTLLRGAGEKAQPTVFCFTDTQIKMESMVEDINNILNTGEVPNLFAGDEVSMIQEALVSRARELGISDAGPGGLWRLFVQQCRANLHVVLCMSPIGDAFRTRLRQFPSLVNCCTIDWFTAWPQDALQTVAEQFLTTVENVESSAAAIVTMCCAFQSTVSELSTEYHAELKRHNYVTPTSYLELIGAFRSMLDKQRGMVTEAKSRYDVGLQKLTETSEQVAGMQAELVELQPKLVVAGKEADELMVKIEVDTKAANVTRANVTIEEAAATKKADEAQAIKVDCEAGLAEALPALEMAVKARSRPPATLSIRACNPIIHASLQPYPCEPVSL